MVGTLQCADLCGFCTVSIGRTAAIGSLGAYHCVVDLFAQLTPYLLWVFFFGFVSETGEKRGLYDFFSHRRDLFGALLHAAARWGDRKKAMFLVALLDHLYWIFGSAVGALLGQAMPLDFTGIDLSDVATLRIYVDSCYIMEYEEYYVDDIRMEI